MEDSGLVCFSVQVINVKTLCDVTQLLMRTNISNSPVSKFNSLKVTSENEV